jgi:Leucine-rich repeat (LRR) protein
MLPPNFVESTSLVELILKDNKIELLPVSFGKLLNLEILDISKNKLTKFRLFERDLPRLKRLDLSENLIDDLDENMTHLS